MPTSSVREPDDPRLAPFVELRRARAEEIVVEGEIAVARALSSTHPISALLLTPSHHERLRSRLPESLPVLVVEAALLREVVGFRFHRGCVAVMPRPRAPSLERALERLVDRGPRLVVVAEGLADPVNLGAIIRNARAFGADLVLHGGGADPWSRRAIRAAMGLGFSLPVLEPDDLAAAVERVRARLGARAVAAVVDDDAVLLPAYSPPSRAVLLVGNEGAGLSASLRSIADDAVTIPLHPEVDSLNAAAATAVLLWALRPSGPTAAASPR